MVCTAKGVDVTVPMEVCFSAPGQRDWPAARDHARGEQIGSARMVLSGGELEAPRLAPLRMTKNEARPREAAQRKSGFTLEPRITRITLIIA